MKKSIKNIKPKANALLEFSSFLHAKDLSKQQQIGESLSRLMELSSFPSPLTKFFQLPKFKELVEKLREGFFFENPPLFQEIQSFQLLTESFHKLVHLSYDFEEIDHPVVRVKVLEQNIQDYLACANIFYPYEGILINDILFDLFQSIQFFAKELKTTVLENRDFFSEDLIKRAESPVIATLMHLTRATYHPHLIEDLYPVTTELHIDSKLSEKKEELKALVKGNAHTLLNQLQTILSDIHALYLKFPPKGFFPELRSSIESFLNEKPKEETLSGQKTNELFYLEFSKDPYPFFLAEEACLLTKLPYLIHRLLPLKNALYELLQEHESILPSIFSFYLKEVISPSEPIFAILGKPNFLAASLSIGFYTTQYEYINELLSEETHQKIPSSCKERIENILPILISFLATYYQTNPLVSLHVMKNLLEHLFSKKEAFEVHSIETIQAHIEKTFSLFTPETPPPFALLEAGFHKLIEEFRLLLNELDPSLIEHKILKEKLFAFEHIDLPSYPQTWYVLGELLSVIFIYMSQVEDHFLGTIDSKLKNLFSYPFFQVLFHQETPSKSSE